MIFQGRIYSSDLFLLHVELPLDSSIYGLLEERIYPNENKKNVILLPLLRSYSSVNFGFKFLSFAKLHSSIDPL